MNGLLCWIRGVGVVPVKQKLLAFLIADPVYGCYGLPGSGQKLRTQIDEIFRQRIGFGFAMFCFKMNQVSVLFRWRHGSQFRVTLPDIVEVGLLLCDSQIVVTYLMQYLNEIVLLVNCNRYGQVLRKQGAYGFW